MIKRLFPSLLIWPPGVLAAGFPGLGPADVLTVHAIFLSITVVPLIIAYHLRKRRNGSGGLLTVLALPSLFYSLINLFWALVMFSISMESVRSESSSISFIIFGLMFLIGGSIQLFFVIRLYKLCTRSETET